MTNPRRDFHNQLKEVTRRYGHAMQRYDQAMYLGDQKRADDALTAMQEIEDRVTIIERPAR